MSRAICCNNCGETLVVDRHGEDVDGESAGWIRLEIANTVADLCTRSCAHEFLDRDDVVKAHESVMETIAEIARTIREVHEEEQS